MTTRCAGGAGAALLGPTRDSSAPQAWQKAALGTTGVEHLQQWCPAAGGSTRACGAALLATAGLAMARARAAPPAVTGAGGTEAAAADEGTGCPGADGAGGMLAGATASSEPGKPVPHTEQ